MVEQPLPRTGISNFSRRPCTTQDQQFGANTYPYDYPDQEFSRWTDHAQSNVQSLWVNWWL